MSVVICARLCFCLCGSCLDLCKTRRALCCVFVLCVLNVSCFVCVFCVCCCSYVVVSCVFLFDTIRSNCLNGLTVCFVLLVEFW